MASLIWSATLSGWPMDTDSLVNRYRSALTDWSSQQNDAPRSMGGIIAQEVKDRQSQLLGIGLVASLEELAGGSGETPNCKSRPARRRSHQPRKLGGSGEWVRHPA